MSYSYRKATTAIQDVLSGLGQELPTAWSNSMELSSFEACTHEVVDGDYLIAIADEYGIPLETVKEMNPSLSRDQINDNRETLPYDYIVPGDDVFLPDSACTNEPLVQPLGWCAPDGTCMDAGFVGDDGSGRRALQERQERDKVVEVVAECGKGPEDCAQKLVDEGVDHLAQNADSEDATLWDQYWAAKRELMKRAAGIAAGPAGWLKDGLSPSTVGDSAIHFDEHGRSYYIDPLTNEPILIEDGPSIGTSEYPSFEHREVHPWNGGI